MQSIVIFHNPRCSKSRSACQMLGERGISVDIVEYLRHPLSREDLLAIIAKLGMPAEKLVRKGEALFKEHYAGKTMSENDFIDAMLAHPNLMERPVLVIRDKAIIARNPDTLKAFLAENLLR